MLKESDSHGHGRDVCCESKISRIYNIPMRMLVPLNYRDMKGQGDEHTYTYGGVISGVGK
jgi:hypothetical protein